MDAPRGADRTLNRRCRARPWTRTATCSCSSATRRGRSRRPARPGVGTLVCVGIDPETEPSLRRARRVLPGCSRRRACTRTTRPRFDARAAFGQIEELLANPPRRRPWGSAVSTSSACTRRAEDQERVLRSTSASPATPGLPLVVHVRDAWPRDPSSCSMRVRPTVVLHCFTRRRRDRRASAPRADGTCPSPGTSPIPKNAHHPRGRRGGPARAASSSRPTARSSRRSGSADATTRPRTSRRHRGHRAGARRDCGKRARRHRRATRSSAFPRLR